MITIIKQPSFEFVFITVLIIFVTNRYLNFKWFLFLLLLLTPFLDRWTSHFLIALIFLLFLLVVLLDSTHPLGATLVAHDWFFLVTNVFLGSYLEIIWVILLATDHAHSHQYTKKYESINDNDRVPIVGCV